MNPPYNNVFRKVESALANYLGSVLSVDDLAGAAIHLGVANETVNVPYIYCHCPDGEEDEIATGNWNVEPEVGIVVNASDETALANAERFGAVMDALCVTNLKALLMAAESDFTVFGVIHQKLETSIEGNQWRNKWRIGMMVCGSAL